MSTLPPLLKAQFDEGLRVRRPRATQDFYKHIYLNTDDRNNQTDQAGDSVFFMQQPIETPPDGTTRLTLHRASIPFTFYNIVKHVGFVVSLSNDTEPRRVLVRPGYYNLTDLVASMNACLNNTGDFSTAPTGPNNGLASLYTVSVTGGKLFSVQFTGVIGANGVKISFIDAETFNDLRGGLVKFVPEDDRFAALAKRTIGYDYYQGDAAQSAAGVNVIISPGIFGPFQEIEVFLRISGLPLNYDLIDGKTGAPSDILAVIPLNVDTFGSVITLSRQDSLAYTIPPNSKIQRIMLRLTYRDGRDIVDLQGQDYSCIISIIKENDNAGD